MGTIPISRVIPHYCGMPERLRRKRRLLVFRAFFDESGTDPKLNKALVMCGFLGRVDEWERASDAWDICLHEKPSIEYFKHSDAQSLDGQFAKFSHASADAKVAALTRTIFQFELQGFCITVPYRLFKHRNARATKGVMGTRVYDWGFLTATTGVLQYLDDKHPGDEKVDFVFDQRSELDACIQHYNWSKTNPFLMSTLRRAGECAPGNDRDVVALQMGDLIAWELCYRINTKEKREAFNIIAASRRLVHIDCRPPRQLPDTLALQKIGKQVQAEAANYFRRAKKGSPDRFASEAEVEAYMNELKIHESFFYLELHRYISQLQNDDEYQEFKREYLAATGEEPPF